MFEFTINGRPISKKNSKRLVRVGGRIIPISSKAYQRFETDALMQLKNLKTKLIDTPCRVSYIFYIQGAYHVDLDNLIAGINDILQKGRIIADDDLITSMTAVKVGGCGGWGTRISISKEPAL